MLSHFFMICFLSLAMGNLPSARRLLPDVTAGNEGEQSEISQAVVLEATDQPDLTAVANGGESVINEISQDVVLEGTDQLNLSAVVIGGESVINEISQDVVLEGADQHNLTAVVIGGESVINGAVEVTDDEMPPLEDVTQVAVEVTDDEMPPLEDVTQVADDVTDDEMPPLEDVIQTVDSKVPQPDAYFIHLDEDGTLTNSETVDNQGAGSIRSSSGSSVIEYFSDMIAQISALATGLAELHARIDHQSELLAPLIASHRSQVIPSTFSGRVNYGCKYAIKFIVTTLVKHYFGILVMAAFVYLLHHVMQYLPWFSMQYSPWFSRRS